MEYSNKLLEDLNEKKRKYNPRFSKWYHRMYVDDGGEYVAYHDTVRNNISMVPKKGCDYRYYNRGERINDCLNLWLWDHYEKNKILDLKRVNRCKNTRFCPNCKMMNAAKFIHEFNKVFPQFADYKAYMLTVTVPSCDLSDDGSVLKSHIEKLNDTFRKLNHKYSRPLFTPSGKLSSLALTERYCSFDGGIKVLEITFDYIHGFHPHFHSIILIKNDIDKSLLEKKYKGKYSRKRQSYNMKSDIDLQVSKAWTMLWYGLNFRHWLRYSYNPREKYLKFDDEFTEFKNLECDFVELDDDGIYEVFKYTFKSSDVKSYNVFKNLVYALENKRIRQGFGCLHNVKCDEDEFDTGEFQDLELAVEPDEIPVQLLTKEIKELYTTFSEYKKISRFEPKNLDSVSIPD